MAYESLHDASIKRSLFSEAIGKMIDAKSVDELDDIRARFEESTKALFKAGFLKADSKIDISERLFECYLEFRVRIHE